MKRIFRLLPLLALMLALPYLLSCLPQKRCDHTAMARRSFLPTCTEAGYIEEACACGYSSRTEDAPPLGHEESSALVSPTCEENGYTEWTCSRCAQIRKADLTEPLGHAYQKEETKPTCTEPGFTLYTCDVCEHAYAGDFQSPAGHIFSAKTTLPTSSTAGFTTYTCHCEFQYEGDHVFSSERFFGAYVSNTEPFAYGIDVSKWNGVIDWQKIRESGVDFVILKVGSTGFGMDPKFEENYAGAKAAGLAVGGYYYTYATNESEILADAEAMISYMAGKQFEYPVYLDIEDDSLIGLGKELLTDMCVSFLEHLQKNGYYSALYSNYNWLFHVLDTQRIVTLFDVWLARWTPDSLPVWSESYTHPRTGVWQYTDSGKIDGHDCNFDLNVSFKDYPSLIRTWGYNGYGIVSDK